LILLGYFILFLKIKTIPFQGSTQKDGGPAGKRPGKNSKSKNRLTLVPAAERKSCSMNMASGLVALSDALVLLATGFLICWYYVGLDSHAFGYYSLAIVLVTIPVILTFSQANLYNIATIFNPRLHIHKILGIWAVMFMVFLAISFSLKVSEHFSRVWCFSWFLSSAFLFCLERYLYSSLAWRWACEGFFSRKLVIVGSGEQTKKFITQLKNKKEPWIRLAGVFDDRKQRIGPAFMELPVLGNMDDLIAYTRKNNVDDIVITLPWSADKRLQEIIRKLEELPVTVSLCSDLIGFIPLCTSFSSMGGVPMLDVVEKPLNGWGYFLKELEDKLLALLSLLFLSPLVLLISLAIKLESRGPVIFRQKRYGFNNKEFTVYKFRSMYQKRIPEQGVPQAKRNDPRVTRVGAFVRKTSLDELPQLFNVLNGTMSIVGPRPHAVAHNEEYSRIIGGYFARHRVKPGITGWAQVNGLRVETNTPAKMKARVEHDLEYIDNWSLLFDATILIKTIPVLLYRHKNAY
jgi:Undecaprenyl-phosphate glucose phosphotransferase